MKIAALFGGRNRVLWIAGAASFTIAAIVTAPATLAEAIAEKNAPLLSIGAANGTVWRGGFSDVSYNGVLLGDLSFNVRPLALLTGRIAADMSMRDGALSAKGRVAISPSRIEVRDATAIFNLGAIRQYTFFGARYEGAAGLKAKMLSLSKSGCEADSAVVSTDVLDTLAKQWSGKTFPLSGTIACKGGGFDLALSGASEDGTATVDVTVAPDFNYTLTFTAEPTRDEAAAALRQFGFEEISGRLSWRAVGRLKGLNS